MNSIEENSSSHRGLGELVRVNIPSIMFWHEAVVNQVLGEGINEWSLLTRDNLVWYLKCIL